MSVYHRVHEKRRIMEEYKAREQELASVLARQITPKAHIENEKKLRREIANSNERRRMQSINAGFQVLRTLIPHGEGEKLSKAAILQLTTEYINNLQQEKSKVIAQNAYFKRVLTEHSRRCNLELSLDIQYGSPPTKRKKRDTESSDEGITADYDDASIEEIRREMSELRRQLEMERQLRMILECKAHAMNQPPPKQEQPAQVNSPVERPPLKPHQEIHLYAKPLKQEDTPKYHPEPAAQPKHELHHRLEPQQPELPPAHRFGRTESIESMSRRNLETIVEAIRHLEGEGDQIHMDHQKTHEVHRPVPPHSEESEKDSSITSDQEDIRSDSSGRDSPSSVHYVKLQDMKAFPVSQSPSHNYIEKYPMVANVLHGNISQPQYYRPGVIVQKS